MEGKQLFGLFLLWFALSFLSNTSIKSALQNAQPPSVTFAQMLIGWLGSYAILRYKKIPTQFSFTTYLPLACLHYGGNLFTNYGIFYGSVSYTQVVKSLEPISTAIFARYLLKDQPPRIAILCMIPIISGVVLVSSGEAEISASLLFVFISNIFLSYRNVSIKQLINNSEIQDPTVLMYRMCFVGTIVSFPALSFEANQLIRSISTVDLYTSGLFYFLYDSCSFLLLFYITVLSHAVGSVMKRVVVITGAIILYHSKILPTTVVGITLCVTGSFLYTYISKSKDEQRAKISRVVYLIVLLSFCSLTTHFFVINPHTRINLHSKNETTPIIPVTTPPTTPPPETPQPHQASPAPLQEQQIQQKIQDASVSTFRPLQELDQSFFLLWTRSEYEFPARLEKTIESILFHHKSATVTLYASYLDGQMPLQQLQRSFPGQVIVERIEIHKIFEDTPLKPWGRHHRTWKWKSVQNFDYHLVDAMRLALLWKNGGIAIDADMILLQPITFPSNVISTYLGEFSTKILKFEPRHPFIKACMEEFVKTYDFTTKGGNGGKLVQRVFENCDSCQKIEIIPILDTPTYFQIDQFYSTGNHDDDESIMLEIMNETNIAFDIQYWENIELTISPQSVIDRLFTQNNLVKDDRIAVPLNKNSLMKFGVWIYEKSINVGDEVQSIANIQYLPRIDYFIARDDPMRYSKLPNITIIANGWFAMNKAWNLPENIHPIFVSFHGIPKFPYNATVPLFKKYEPIGCRDKYTERRFKAVGVDAYYSGCITTTMENIYDKPRNNNIYKVDSNFPFSKNLLDLMTDKTHVVSVALKKNHTEKLTVATGLLELYGTCKLIITHRIHCALPSLGMGTPVIFSAWDFKKSFTDPEQLYKLEPRFTGLVELFSTIFQNTTTTAEVEAYPYANPPPNKPHDDMKQRIWTHLQKSPFIKESGRMFGMYK